MVTALNDHIVTSYKDELINLTKAISEMGGMVEHAIIDAANALLRLDQVGAQEVRRYDRQIDEMKDGITQMAVSIIARRQPVAADLRTLVTAIQVANDLERTGDMAKQLAKRTAQIESLGLAPRFYNGVKHMTDLVARQLKAALDAYVSRDAAKAVDVCSRDTEIDAMHVSLFRELLTYMMEDPRNISPCIHLLFCTKSLERVGDHATNIAEAAYYLETGRQLGPDETQRQQL